MQIESYFKILTRSLGLISFFIASASTANTQPADLIAAVRQGNLTFIQQAVESGTDINSRDQHGDSLIVLALRFKQKAIWNYLCSKGAVAPICRGPYDPVLTQKLYEVFKTTGDLSAMRVLLSQGADPSYTGYKETFGHDTYTIQPILNTAASSNQLSVMEVFLHAGAEIDLRSKTRPYTDEIFRETPLSAAVTANKIGSARMLLEYGADPSLETEYIPGSAPPLAIAIQKRETQLIDLLLSASGVYPLSKTLSRLFLNDARTASPQYTKQEIRDLTQKLLKQGADPLLKQNDNSILMSILVSKDFGLYYVDSVRLLLDLKPDLVKGNRQALNWATLSGSDLTMPNPTMLELLLNAGATAPTASIFQLVYFGWFDIAQMYVEHGISLTEPVRGMSIFWAMLSEPHINKIAALNFLARQKVDFNEYGPASLVELPHYYPNSTAIEYYANEPNIRTLLLKNGADINRFSKDGRSNPLFAFYKTGSREAVLSFLSTMVGLGANPELRNSEGESLLGIILSNNCIYSPKCAIAVLPFFKKQFNETFEIGRSTTPLIYACDAYYKADSELIKTLLDMGAKVNEVDRYRLSALMRAVSWQNIESLKLLLSAGADKSMKNPNGETAFDLAKGWPEGQALLK